tara:strand:+ start:342 stop:1037 length:696 start_codon:yes stop_codon:yes gene_type:complete
MRKIHISDSNSKNTFVHFSPIKAPSNPVRAFGKQKVYSKRLILSGEKSDYENLLTKYEKKLPEILLNEDPELDLKLIGRPIEKTNTVFVNKKNEILRVAPNWIELIFDQDGNEKERRVPEDRLSNITDDLPIRFTKMKLKRKDAVRKFVFSRTLQLWHSDGLTFEFLFNIAKELDDNDEMMLVGSGEKGRGPLIFQNNGLPWRAFLEGRVKDNSYALLMRLSNLELKSLNS